jgi:hypothetical protein
VGRTQRIAAVPILATRDPAPGANVRVEVKIVAAGRSVKAHETTPSETLLLSNAILIWRIVGEFAAHLDMRNLSDQAAAC